MASNDLQALTPTDIEEELLVGPGSDPDQGEAPRPMLEGASEYEYVEIFNPLSVTFVGMFGVTKPVTVPFKIGGATAGVKSEADVRQLYGLELKNPLHEAKQVGVNRVPIKSGQTIRLLGSEAQVVARQLVNEIMQREGMSIKLADPFARSLVEKRIVRRRGTVAEVLGRSPISIQEQLQSVKEETHEEQFPELKIPRRVAEPVAEDRPGKRDTGQSGIRIEKSEEPDSPSKS